MAEALKQKKSPTYIIELLNVEKNLLDDRSLLRRMLNVLLIETNLHKMSNIRILKDDECHAINKGMSGDVLIKESGIYFHAFPERNWIRVIVSSCQDFEVNKVRDFLLNFFKTNNYEECLFKGGYDIKYTNKGEKI